MSWAMPSPRLLRGSVVRTNMQVFAVAGEPIAQPAVLMVVATEGQPPVGGSSSQFAFVPTPVIPAKENARTKCCAAAQKSGLPIAACHGKVVVPAIVPVGQAVLKLQLYEVPPGAPTIQFEPVSAYNVSQPHGLAAGSPPLIHPPDCVQTGIAASSGMHAMLRHAAFCAAKVCLLKR